MIPTLLILIPSLPLLATIVTAVLGRSVLKEKSHLPIIIALIGSFICSFSLLIAVQRASNAEETMIGWETTVDLWNWVRVDNALSTKSAEFAVPVKGGEALPGGLPF